MQRLHNMDLAKLFAMFFIVVIHTAPFRNLEFLGVETDLLGQGLNIFSRFAVPFFFMVAGYLYYEKKQKNASVASTLRRLSKLFLVWAGFYFLSDILFNYLVTHDGATSLEKSLKTFASPLMLYYGPYHLWFLASLIYATIILHIGAKFDCLRLLLVCGILLYCVGLFGQSYNVFANLPLQTRDTLFFSLFFIVAGYYIAKNKEKIRGDTRWYLGFFILFSCAQMIEGLMLIQFFSARLGNYYVATIPVSIAFMLLIMSKKIEAVPRALSRISRNTLGIYLLHPFLIKAIRVTLELNGWDGIKETLLWHTLYTPFIFIGTYLLYELGRKLFFLFKQKPLHWIRSVFT